MNILAKPTEFYIESVMDKVDAIKTFITGQKRSENGTAHIPLNIIADINSVINTFRENFIKDMETGPYVARYRDVLSLMGIEFELERTMQWDHCAWSDNYAQQRPINTTFPRFALWYHYVTSARTGLRSFYVSDLPICGELINWYNLTFLNGRKIVIE